jgi:hypothetical protein
MLPVANSAIVVIPPQDIHNEDHPAFRIRETRESKAKCDYIIEAYKKKEKNTQFNEASNKST